MELVGPKVDPVDPVDLTDPADPLWTPCEPTKWILAELLIIRGLEFLKDPIDESIECF